MNATPLLLAGSLVPSASMRPTVDEPPSATLAVSSFRCLLDEVWRTSEPRLAKLAIGLGLRADRAADVLQDVYVMAIERPPAINEPEELVRWLFRVTVNRCHLEHRRRGRWQRLWQSLTAFVRESETPGRASDGELAADVGRALAALNGDDRTLVAMRYFSELNSRQIAAIVGIPEATVRGRLRAARRKLAVELAEWNDES